MAKLRPSHRQTEPPPGAPRVGARVEATLNYTGTIEAYRYNVLTERLEAEVRPTRFPHVVVRLPVADSLHEVAWRELPSDQPGTISA